jgi:hypothetical protein
MSSTRRTGQRRPNQSTTNASGANRTNATSCDRNRIQTIRAVVLENGHFGDSVEVLKSLDAGLDQRAVAAQ